MEQQLTPDKTKYKMDFVLNMIYVLSDYVDKHSKFFKLTEGIHLSKYISFTFYKKGYI